MAKRQRASVNRLDVGAGGPNEMKETGEQDSALFADIQHWFRRSRDHWHKWRIEARLCYDFVAGEQWETDDVAKMRLENRPIVTFNRTSSVVDSVSGLEVNNRQEVRYIPRQLGAAGVNELLTEAARWVRDECNAEDQESDAFVDEVICGIGVCETTIEYDENPDGKICVYRVDPIEMFIDGNSRQGNCIDARHIFRVRQVPLEVAEDMFPGVSVVDLDAVWARDISGEAREPHDATEAPFYRNDQSPNIDKTADMVTLVEVQWWVHEKGYRVADPLTGKMLTVSEDEHDTLKKRGKQIGLQIQSAPFKKRVYKRAFVGSKIIKELDGPEEGGFTYKFMTGKRDRNHGVWYGLVRAMIDPQRWANKWLAQVMHIINTNAKGGLIAEEDAFENPQEAEETWADPSAITMVTPGAIEKKKIMPKPVAAYPTGIDRLMQFAISSIRDVSGVNLELLGMSNRDQPGVLEQQRKQAGLTILAGLFDALREYRKQQGRLLLYYIRTFISDGRLIRIGDPQDAQYVSLIHDDSVIEFDVIVDDTPTSANMKEQTWAVLVQMMPFLAKLPVPLPVWMQILKSSPLPASFVADLTKALSSAQQGQGQAPPNPDMIEAQAKAQSLQAITQMKGQQTQASLQATQMKSQATIAKTQADLQRTAAETKRIEAETQAAQVSAQTQQAASQHDMRLQGIQALMEAMGQAHEAQQASQQQQADQDNAAQRLQGDLDAQQAATDTAASAAASDE